MRHRLTIKDCVSTSTASWNGPGRSSLVEDIYKFLDGSVSFSTSLAFISAWLIKKN